MFIPIIILLSYVIALRKHMRENSMIQTIKTEESTVVKSFGDITDVSPNNGNDSDEEEFTVVSRTSLPINYAHQIKPDASD